MDAGAQRAGEEIHQNVAQVDLLLADLIGFEPF